MEFAASTNAIRRLAGARPHADREHLLLALVELCDASQGTQVMSTGPVQTLLGSIFMSVAVEADHDIRQRLAEKLSSAPWTPQALANVLALDDIAIARPLIAGSAALTDADLVRVLHETTVEHQIEVARRPRLGATVVEAILRQSDPSVLTALAGNIETRLSTPDLEVLAEASRRIASIRSPLSRHPDLTAELAQRLYVWVGPSTRQTLAGRFRLDLPALEKALADRAAVNAGERPFEAPAGVAWARPDEREEMERRLIAKLEAAGQLRPTYLLRTLREGKLNLFIAGLCALGSLDPDEVRRAINSDQPELLGLACAAVGIDRSVFPALLNLVRDLNGGRPGGGAEGARRATGAFAAISPAVAAASFRQGVRAV